MKLLETLPSMKVKLSDIGLNKENPNVMSKDQLRGLEMSMKIANVMDLVINDHPSTRKLAQGKKYWLVDGHQKYTILNRYHVRETLAKVTHLPHDKALILAQAMNKAKGQPDLQKDAAIFKFLHEANLLELLSDITATPLDDFKIQIDRFYDLGLHQGEEQLLPDVPKSSKTKIGDIYQIGKHKIMCGDSRNADHVKKLFGKKLVNQIMTDPPYGVDYQSKNELLKKFGKGTHVQFDFANENRDDYRAFYSDFLKLVPMTDVNTIYVFSGGMRLHDLRMAMEDAGFTWGDYLIWNKNRAVFGRKDYKAKHEFIVYGWKGRHQFFGGYQDTVFDEPNMNVNELHPTMKPVPLVSKFILHGTKKDDLVYDPFAGSGTTIISCENEGRTCYALELIPHFIDVIVARWEGHTNKKAKKL